MKKNADVVDYCKCKFVGQVPMEHFRKLKNRDGIL